MLANYDAVILYISRPKFLKRESLGLFFYLKLSYVKTILLAILLSTVFASVKSQEVYLIYSKFDNTSNSWQDTKGIIYIGNDSMYVSTSTEFLKIRFLEGIEGAISNRDPESKNLMYRQNITLYDYTNIVKCSFETITDKEDFSGIFSFYTFDTDYTSRVFELFLTCFQPSQNFCIYILMKNRVLKLYNRAT